MYQKNELAIFHFLEMGFTTKPFGNKILFVLRKTVAETGCMEF